MQLEEEQQIDSSLLVGCPGCPKCLEYHGYLFHMSAGRCTKSHEYLFLLTKSARYYYDAEAIKEDCTADHPAGNNSHKGTTAYLEGAEEHRTKQGLVAYAQKTRKVKMPDGWDTGAGGHGSFHRNGREKGETRELGEKGECSDSSEVRSGKGAAFGRGAGWREDPNTTPEKRNKRSVWTIATQPYSEAHFATFPEALVEPCILAGSKVGDTVLDPFCGSGTTGVVALRYQREFIGIELNHAYAELAKKRIGAEAPMFNDVSVLDSATACPS
jgi:site-specific DNA-methyltransferase (cytosine-N4-specific)